MNAPARIDKCPRCGGDLLQRSTEQNAKLHSLLSDIADQKQWAGQWLDRETWKRLLVAAWTRAEGHHVRIFPALDGGGVDMVYERTSRMSKQEMISLIDYVTAWAVDQGVKLRDTPPLEAA